ncbi:YaiI/YqxD family protein [Azospira sp. APE16]|uniref:YaiI/YqxD family protein n=1 Tax=Azospira sp. APE16 TaxID=3394231 RepID=UPI003A4D737E
MQIWVDADACPKAIKEILFRVATRTQILVTLVANQALYAPPSPYLRSIQVPKGFDVADNEIVARVAAGDLVITADIPLAAEVIAKGARVLTPRGEPYDKGTIQAALSMRNFMDTLRSAGVETGGPAAMSQSDRHVFAQQLERLLPRG